MRRITFLCAMVVCVATLWLTTPAFCQESIVIGVPTSLTALEGRESLKAVELAVGEINAKGGVKVGDAKHLLKIETIDLRDSSPGVPVSEALLGMEKMITEKKVNAIVVGPFRSEALLAGMELACEVQGSSAWNHSHVAKIRRESKTRSRQIQILFPCVPELPATRGIPCEDVGILAY